MPKSSIAMVTPRARMAFRLAMLCFTSSMTRLSVISSSSPAAASGVDADELLDARR